jgi:hypothetical protein
MNQSPWMTLGGSIVNAAVNYVGGCHSPLRILEEKGQIKAIIKTEL